MKLTELYDLYLQHPTVTTDSRNCPAGSIFFALKGERFDGNKYAEGALASGAAYAVIDNAEYKSSERMILVDDVLSTLQQLARLHRHTLGIPVIGITGTNGKTTTKELLAAVLSRKYNLLYTAGNLNNQIGVPLTILKMTAQHEMAVIEMGANHPGDIKELVEIAAPNYGLITNVGRAHLEGFGSFEGVMKTKGELYDFIRHNGGKIFLNASNPYLPAMANGLESITYGTGSDCFVYGEETECNPFLSFSWTGSGNTYNVKTHLIGSYNLDNLLAAVAVGSYFGVPAEAINNALESYMPTNNRSQFKQTERNSLIIDAYNANPSSMKVAIDNFAAMNGSPKAVVLGDMKELGLESDALHLEVVEQLRRYGFDKVYLCGEHFSNVASGFSPFATTADMVEALKKNNLSGFHILIKGSHSMGLEKVADLL